MFAVHEFGLNYWNDRPRFSGLNMVVVDVCMYAGSGSRCPSASAYGIYRDVGIFISFMVLPG